ncbi:MAG: alpha amylase C-terminal domain-containing protein [Vampirovibrionales bacterium]|nr:alpha amylase C-terminal domain-containing protein [Vampirovibrionales bacterium]
MTPSSVDVQSQRLGASLRHENGRSHCIFRVWAPHAQQVFVTGTFSDLNWKDKAVALEKNDVGVWSAVVEGGQPGDEYRIQLQTPNGDWVERRDPYGREVNDEHTASIIVEDDYDWRAPDFAMPAWNELVLYEIHVGTFNAKEEKPSTFDDCLKKIHYLKELGVNAIAIMPICAFPGDYSWGYNPSDFFAVENIYGGAQQLKKFVDTCHQHGLSVILDLVYNHAGPDNLDLWQFDGWSENDKGGVYFYQDHRASTPWGHTRFDYGRSEVRNFIHDNVMMWLDEFKLDGARFDATVYIRKVDHVSVDDDLTEGWSLLQWINESKNEKFPGKITIAEDIGSEPWVVKSVGEGGAGFDAQWDTEFVHVIRSQIIAPNDSDRSMNLVKQIVEKKYNDNAFQRVIYSESHDDVANGKARVTYEIDHEEGDNRSFFSKKRSILGAGVALTSPGIPMIFQGQEMLENMWFEDTDPLDWFLAKKYKGIIHAYRDLIKLRRNVHGTTAGLMGHHCDVFHVNDEQKVIAYHRWNNGGAGDNVIVVANFANIPHENYNIGMPKPGLWKVRFNSSSKVYDPYIDDFESVDTEAYEAEKDEHAWNANVGLGAYALVILSQDAA